MAGGGHGHGGGHGGGHGVQNKVKSYSGKLTGLFIVGFLAVMLWIVFVPSSPKKSPDQRETEVAENATEPLADAPASAGRRPGMVERRIKPPVETIEVLTCQGPGAILATVAPKASVTYEVPGRTCAETNPSPGTGASFAPYGSDEAHQGPWVLSNNGLFTYRNDTDKPQQFSCTYRPMNEDNTCSRSNGSLQHVSYTPAV